MAQKLRRDTPALTDIPTLLHYAITFLVRLYRLERASPNSFRVLTANVQQSGCTSFITKLRAHRKTYNPPTHPSRDPKRSDEFLIELFAFVCAVRAAEDFIKAATRCLPNAKAVTAALASDPYVRFHRKLANQRLHGGMIGSARTYFVGGDRHSEWEFNYNVESFQPDTRIAYDALPKIANYHGGIVELGRRAVAALTRIYYSAL
jgi:hypothetical protein